MELSFAAVPVTPFANLQQYFADPIPVSELEEERARALADLGVVSPGTLAAATAAFDLETRPDAKARGALAVADLHGRRPHMDEALLWLRKAVEAYPSDERSASLDAARRFAASHGVLHGDEIRQWIAGLPETYRATPLMASLDETLLEGEKREAARRARYLWP